MSQAVDCRALPKIPSLVQAARFWRHSQNPSCIQVLAFWASDIMHVWLSEHQAFDLLLLAGPEASEEDMFYRSLAEDRLQQQWSCRMGLQCSQGLAGSSGRGRNPPWRRQTPPPRLHGHVPVSTSDTSAVDHPPGPKRDSCQRGNITQQVLVVETSKLHDACHKAGSINL